MSNMAVIRSLNRPGTPLYFVMAEYIAKGDNRFHSMDKHEFSNRKFINSNERDKFRCYIWEYWSRHPLIWNRHGHECSRIWKLSGNFITRIIQSLYYSPASRWMHSLKKSVKPEIVNRYDLWVLRHKIGGAKVFVNNVQWSDQMMLCCRCETYN